MSEELINMSEKEKYFNYESTEYQEEGETIWFDKQKDVVEMQENFEDDQMNHADFEIDDVVTQQRRSKYHVKIDRFLTNGIIIAAILLVVLICYILFG